MQRLLRLIETSGEVTVIPAEPSTGSLIDGGHTKVWVPTYAQQRNLSCEFASMFIATAAFGDGIPSMRSTRSSDGLETRTSDIAAISTVGGAKPMTTGSMQRHSRGRWIRLDIVVKSSTGSASLPS